MKCEHKNFILRDKTFSNGKIHKEKICEKCEKHFGFVRSISNEEFIMPFGKYKDIPLKELIIKDKEYCSFLIKNGRPGNTINRLKEIMGDQ